VGRVGGGIRQPEAVKMWALIRTRLPRTRLPVEVAVAVALAVGCSWFRPDHKARGRAEAERDLAAGRLCIRSYGLPPPWLGRYVARARADLGVEIEAVGGCEVDDAVVARAEGYNEIMSGELDRRFGPGALGRLTAEVVAEHERDAAAGGPP
jgi:hypothetical protein